MSKINTGGPAFARPAGEYHDGNGPNSTVYSQAQSGMTLRAWLAGQALANPKICDSESEHWHRNNAQYAVAAADALIAELEKSNG